ncbi:MAG: hypothetical protein ACFCVE_06770 [Phycisphaerae bacterium]
MSQSSRLHVLLALTAVSVLSSATHAGAVVSPTTAPATRPAAVQADLSSPAAWADRLLDAALTVEDFDTRAELAGSAASIHLSLGRPDEARRVAVTAMEGQTPTASYYAASLLTLAGRGDEAIDLAAADEEAWMTLGDVALAAAWAGDDATRLAAAERAGDDSGEAVTLFAAHLLRDDAEAGSRALKQLNGQIEEAFAYATLAREYAYLDQPKKAAAWEEQAAATQAQAEAAGLADDDETLQFVLETRVATLSGLSRPAEAEPLVLRMTDPWSKVYALHEVQAAYLRIGKADEAERARRSAGLLMLANDVTTEDVAWSIGYVSAHDEEARRQIWLALDEPTYENATRAAGVAMGLLDQKLLASE